MVSMNAIESEVKQQNSLFLILLRSECHSNYLGSIAKPSKPEMKNLFKVFQKFFPKILSMTLPIHQNQKFGIELFPILRPQIKELLWISTEELKELNKPLCELLQAGLVLPYASSWMFSVLIVAKKTASFWINVDKRGLNQATFELQLSTYKDGLHLRPVVTKKYAT